MFIENEKDVNLKKIISKKKLITIPVREALLNLDFKPSDDLIVE
jgi:hypothetical protein